MSFVWDGSYETDENTVSLEYSDWYSFSITGNEYSFDMKSLHNYPLYQGTKITVSQSASLKFITYSGQMQMMNDTVNPISPGTVMTLAPGTYYRVGEDITAGVYDFSMADGNGYLRCGMASEDGSDMMREVYREIWLDTSDLIPSYKNIVLKDGMLVYLDEYAEGTATLTPSKVIDANGYDTYYELYW